MDVGDEFAEWSKALRAAMGYSQKDAASRYGVSSAYVGLIETGERIPPVKRVEQMVQSLVDAGVPVDLDEVLAVREQARAQRGRAALRGLSSNAVSKEAVADLMAETDRDAPSGPKPRGRKVGRPSRVQRLREELDMHSSGLDEGQLQRVLGYVEALKDRGGSS